MAQATKTAGVVGGIATTAVLISSISHYLSMMAILKYPSLQTLGADVVDATLIASLTSIVAGIKEFRLYKILDLAKEIQKVLSSGGNK